MPIITLKDENRNPVIDPLTGRQVRVDVSAEVAAFLTQNASAMKKLKNIDDRHFELRHFEDRAWANSQRLSTGYSTEDKCLGTMDEAAAAEHAHYLKRLARCRRAYRMLREACTPTQWRRFILNRYCDKTTRDIAKMEARSFVAVAESIVSAEKKLKKIFSDLP